MPLEVEKCIKKVKKNVTPRDPKQTEDAAWAICTDAYKKKQSSLEESIMNIKNTAKQILTRDTGIAQKLTRVAQNMESMMPEMMGAGAPMAAPMSAPSAVPGPSDVNVDIGGQGSTGPGAPIESFHKPIKQVRTHKITMTFEAPPDMSEGDIMDTFFKIMPDSGLQPLNFSWADATPSQDGSKTTTPKR